MRSQTLLGIAVVLICILGVIVLIHTYQSDQRQTVSTTPMEPQDQRTAQQPTNGLDPSLLPDNPSPLPRMVDLGADSCVPCKLMAPILKELQVEYADVFATHFIDVWKNPGAGRPFGVRIIPTQIFFDANGRELFRHEGFMSKQDILKRWQRLGVDVAGDRT